MRQRKIAAFTLIILASLSVFVALNTARAVSPGGTVSAVEANSSGGTVTPTTSSWTQLASTSPDGNAWTTGTYVGDIVYVNIVISGVPYSTSGTGSKTVATTDIYGWFLNLNWSPSTLNLTKVQEGSYLSQDGSTLVIGNSAALFDNVHGTLLGGASDGYTGSQVLSMTGTDAATEVSGGTLLELQFIVTGAGTGTVTVSGVELYDNSADAAAGNGVAATLTNNVASVTLNIVNDQLTVVSAHGSPTPPVGTDSFLDGTTVPASVASPVTVGSSTYTCTGWTGTGSVIDINTGDTSGTSDSVTFVMDSTEGTSTLTWNWEASASSGVTLTVTSAYGSPSPAVGTQTYTSGTSVTASVSSPVTVSGATYTCTGWTGTGSVPASGTTTSTTFTITETSTITWNWELTSGGAPETLTVSSAYGNPNPAVGSTTYNSGQSVTCTMPTTSLSENGEVYNTVTSGGVTYACTGWTGTGSVPATGTGTTTTFTITQTSTITWNWITLPAYLDVYTDHGGQGWNVTAAPYAPESQVTIYASLTYGGAPVSQQLITFNIYDTGTEIDSRTATTGSNGIATTSFRLPLTLSDGASAFGIVNITSSVSIGGTALNDSCAFMYNYLLKSSKIQITGGDSYSTSTAQSFSRNTGSKVTVEITVANINWTAVSFYITATIYDNNNVPVSYVCLPEAIAAAQSGNIYSTNTATITITLTIPTYAYVGAATLYVNLYNNNPANLGTPYCPEYSAQLLIDASQ